MGIYLIDVTPQPTGYIECLCSPKSSVRLWISIETLNKTFAHNIEFRLTFTDLAELKYYIYE